MLVDCRLRALRRTVLVAACWAVLLGVTAAAPASAQSAGQRWDATYFFASGTYDPVVPTPESVLGFPIGTRPVRYDEMRRYFDAVDAASARVVVRPYAR